MPEIPDVYELTYSGYLVGTFKSASRAAQVANDLIKAIRVWLDNPNAPDEFTAPAA